MSEKTEKPTPHKLREARKKGEVANSRELNGTVGFIAMLLVCWLGAHAGMTMLIEVFGALLDQSFKQPTDWSTALMPALETLVWTLMLISLPLFAVDAFGSIAAGLAQTGGVFSGEPMKLKWDRMNPVEGLTRMFSTRTLFEVMKVTLKIATLGVITTLLARDALPVAIRGVYASSEEIMSVSGHLLFLLFACCAAVYLVASTIDYAHQYYEFMKGQRMSMEELRNEHKNLEGNPLIRGVRRSLARREAMSAQATTVRKASVLVVNPTHYAVALYYQKGETPLPRVVNKGVDSVALEMRRIAQSYGVPIIENRKLARGLHGSAQIDDFIPPQWVDEVATVFKWLQEMQKASGSPASSYKEFRA